VAIAGAFALWIRHESGPAKALDFGTAYLLEEALSIDNLFVFLILFRALAVPARHQHRVLFWGILGAILTRGAFIAAGTALVHQFEWIFWIFGAVLVLTGVRLLRQQEEVPHPERNPLARLFMKLFPMTRDYRDGAFVVREGAGCWRRRCCWRWSRPRPPTSSSPWTASRPCSGSRAIPSSSNTSNIFAILGLRSLFTLLAGVMDRFHYLKIGLAFVLMFIGAKMLLKQAIGWEIGTAGR